MAKIGESSAACSRIGCTVAACRKLKTSPSGKLCCSASAIFSPLSVAAACNSKLNPTQKRLRNASPQALLMRPPNGAWMTNCIPPPSSKKRSAITVVCVGTAPRTARPCRMYSIACSAPESSRPHSSFSHETAAATSGCVAENPTGEVCGSISLISCRRFPICSESSWVRAGASPRQNGTLGGAPCASCTSTRPALVSTRRIIHDVFPSSMMSPRLLSTAKSSSTVPTTRPSGSATTA